MQKTSFVRQNVFPILAAFIWGTSFVAQSMGADYVPAFTFNAARAAIAALALLGVSLLFRRLRRQGRANGGPEVPTSRRDLLVGGISCGTVLTVATNLQQLGIETTSAGKAGFITALYIVIVPLLGLFLHKKPRLPCGQAWLWLLRDCIFCASRMAFPFRKAIFMCCCARLGFPFTFC